MRKKQLGVVCMKMVIQWEGGDESTERCSVHDEKHGTEIGALGDTTGGGTQGRESVITSDTEGARWQVGLKPVKAKAVDTAQVHCVCNTIQLSEICDFRVSAFCQVVEKRKLFEVAQ